MTPADDADVTRLYPARWDADSGLGGNPAGELRDGTARVRFDDPGSALAAAHLVRLRTKEPMKVFRDPEGVYCYQPRDVWGRVAMTAPIADAAADGAA